MTHQLHAGDIAITRLPFCQKPGVVEAGRQHQPLSLGGPATEILEGAGQQALLHVGHRQILIHPAHLALQAVKGQPPGHLLLAQAGNASAAGDRLLQRQLQIALGKLQHTGLGRAGERAVVAGADQVITAGGEGHPLGTARRHLFNQMGVQLAAGVQRHGVMGRGDQLGGLIGEGIGTDKCHPGTVTGGQLAPLFAQGRLQLQAQHLGLTVQGDQPPQVALACTPLQIGAAMGWQAGGEGFNLGLLAPRHVHRHGPLARDGLARQGL